MHRRISVRHIIGFTLLSMLVLTPPGGEHTWAQNRDAELEALKQQVEELRRQEAGRQRQIEELQRKIDQLQIQPAPDRPAKPPASALDKAIQELEASPAQPKPPTPPALLSR